MTRKLALLGALAVTGPANAAFLEIEWWNYTTIPATWTFGNFAATDLTCYWVYVAGLDPTIAVDAVFGDTQSPLTVSTWDPNGFFNWSDPTFWPATNWHIPAVGLGAINASAQWDTGFALGDASVPTLRFSPGFPNLAGGGVGSGEPIVNHTNIAWFNLDPGVGIYPDLSGRLFIGQFTMDELGGFEIELSIQLAGGAQERGLRYVYPPPAPGALALFGIAGLCTARRRRG